MTDTFVFGQICYLCGLVLGQKKNCNDFQRTNELLEIIADTTKTVAAAWRGTMSYTSLANLAATDVCARSVEKI
jgi:hypothetical protein